MIASTKATESAVKTAKATIKTHRRQQQNKATNIPAFACIILIQSVSQPISPANQSTANRILLFHLKYIDSL